MFDWLLIVVFPVAGVVVEVPYERHGNCHAAAERLAYPDAAKATEEQRAFVAFCVPLDVPED